MTNPLGDLVLSHCERTGDTLAAIARRGGMNRQTLSAIVNRKGPGSTPRRETLEALARGLGLPYESVRQAAALSAYGDTADAQPRRLIRLLVLNAQGLTDADLEVVLATTRALRHAQR